MLAIVQAQTLVKPLTMGMTLFQTFFDNFTTNFFNPLLMTLPERLSIDLVPNGHFDKLEFLTFDFNLTNLNFISSSLNPAAPLIQLGANEARLQINELSLELEFDYRYITDPPIFADIGTAYLGVEGMTVDFMFNSTYNGNFSINLWDMRLDFLPGQPHPLFDGISDFSVLVTNVMTTVFAVVRNRLSTLINSQLINGKFAKIVNGILHLFPQTIPLGAIDLVGFLAGNPVSTPHYLYLPMSTIVTSEDHPYTGTCNVQLPEVMIPLADFQM